MTLLSTGASFLRRNIVVVLAVPPVVAAAFGIYAKLIRQRRSAAVTDEHAVRTEHVGES